MTEFTKEELKILRYGLDLIPRKDNQLIIELEDKIESMLDRISCIHLYQPISVSQWDHLMNHCILCGVIE